MLAIGEDRHPGTRHFKNLFNFDHLTGHARAISFECHDLAQGMIDELKDGPELSAGLRKLWEAKNNFVLQSLIDQDKL